MDKTTKTTRSSSRLKTPAFIPATTRTTRAKTATTKATPPAAPAATKKTTIRKPLVNRDNIIEIVPIPKPQKKPRADVRKVKAPNGPVDADREPIMAYLRIRPHLGEEQPTSLPYLMPLSDTSVRMTDPHYDAQTNGRFRPSTLPPTSNYTFSHIFLPQTTQSDFFTKTTLPLVRDVLQGQNALLFTYGVTNSGKTYTVQGGTKEGCAGILPRTLDVVFNSIEGLHADGRYRPVRLHGVERADPSESNAQLNLSVEEPALAEVLAEHIDAATTGDADTDPTVLTLDRNYEYSIWLSYAEVYNEKVYDLLESVKGESHDGEQRLHTSKPSTNTPLILKRRALALKSSPPSDNALSDYASTGKYISGLRHFRVRNASEAKALVKLGQLHRRVFGTLANRESSRSHGMVIIKVVRGHRGERDDPTSLQISRLTLVDLAGSERTKHTHTTGDRLKEAGNINKSLMVLGQCMEVMRSNQRKVAASLGVAGHARVDTREVKKGLAVVPFRHSKLTEVLMDYFVGDGRAVMIVNVNPYDTGYDENSHVMKFAALAREVYVTPAPAPVHRVPPTPGKAHKKSGESERVVLKDPELVPAPFRRKVTISAGGAGGRKFSEAVVEVVEEDEDVTDAGDDDDDDAPNNPLVDALFDEVEELRMQLFEAHMRCAMVEAETREEVMREMEERMGSMARMYARRIMTEVEQNERKTDAKIDMLHQSGLFGSPTKARTIVVKSELPITEETDEDTNVVSSANILSQLSIDFRVKDEFDHDAETESNPASDAYSTSSRSTSMSPLAGKGKSNAHSRTSYVQREIRESVPDGPAVTRLPSDDEDEADVTETEADTESIAESGLTHSEGGEDTNGEGEEEDDEWAERSPTPSPAQSPSPPPTEKPQRFTRKSSAALSKLTHGMHDMSMDGSGDDSIIILPAKKYRAKLEESAEETDSEDEVKLVPKKKRQLGNNKVVTEEEIGKVATAAGRSNGRNIRRLTGWEK